MNQLPHVGNEEEAVAIAAPSAREVKASVRRLLTAGFLIDPHDYRAPMQATYQMVPAVAACLLRACNEAASCRRPLVRG